MPLIPGIAKIPVQLRKNQEDPYSKLSNKNHKLDMIQQNKSREKYKKMLEICLKKHFNTSYLTK